MDEMERLQMIMQKEELNAKDFALEVGISAATMSNILNRKNKPSLEVLQKVLGRFRMVSSDWLILGVGTMYKLKQDATEQSLFDIKPEIPQQDPALMASASIQSTGSDFVQTPSVVSKTKPVVQIVERPVEKKVTRVLVFFDDGTFQELSNL